MNTRFEIEPGYADALRAAGLADFDALFNAAPSGPPTSKHKHRETVPIEFDVNGKRQRFFLKRVFKVPGQHSWRPWLRGKPGYSQPAREWDNIKMMREAGLPVMKRVAVGERRKFGIPVQAFILVEDVGMQWTLENWLIPGFPKPPNIDKVDTRQLWYELGKLYRQFDLAGITWPDIHPKHLYAEPMTSPADENVPWQLALIDVERATQELASTTKNGLGRPLRRVYTNWIPFWRSLDHVPRSALAQAHFDAGNCNFEVRVPEPSTPPKFTWMTGSFPLPDSYVHPRSEGVRWQNGIKATDRDRALLARLGIHDVESAFALTSAQNLDKAGLQRHRDRLRLTASDENGRELILFIKRYRRPPLREQIRRIIEADRTHSTAYHEYHSARRLMECEIPTMRSLAVGEEMRGWCEQRSFIVTAAVEGESLESLARAWQARRETTPGVKERWELLYRVAMLTLGLRMLRLYHRDLYLSHIFLSRNNRGELVLQLIDLARALHAPRFWKRWEIKDLAALAYSVPPGLLTRTDRLRFLLYRGNAYLECNEAWRRVDPYGQSMRRRLLGTIRKINRRVAKMAKHDAKRAARFATQCATVATKPNQR